ncbi:MAG: hypothetical protein ACREQ2_11425, partial [Candidatus Binatia bacterium]
MNDFFKKRDKLKKAPSAPGLPCDSLNMTMLFRPRWYFFIALVSITFIGPLSIHLFIPAMPAVKEAFGVSTGM